MLPGLLWQSAAVRLARGDANQTRAAKGLALALDKAISRIIQPCDVMIGMSGMCNALGKIVKEKFGAQVWIERGSRHILSQQEILAKIGGAPRVSDFAVSRELIDYEQADTIAVLSKHCEESFLERGFTPERVLRNPLGVDLQMFRTTPAPPREPPTIIMSGTWSLRKGCDVLVEAWQGLPLTRLIHVGPVADCPLPNDAHFVHYDKVDQSRLINFYKQAHVFALASREEGLATVQPQALACGLRLVCTSRTGGEDLKEYVSDPSAIRVVSPDDPGELAAALRASLEDAAQDSGERRLLVPDAQDLLSWKAYGRRYSQALLSRIPNAR
jgi:glycosyltransferase involved in cell wall biosynthesis